MSDESTLSAPDLVGSSDSWDDSPAPAKANDSWDDEPEAQEAPAKPANKAQAPKAKADPEKPSEPKPEAPKAKAPEPIVEIDGRKLTPAEIKRELEKARGAEQRFREAAERSKQVEQFLEAFKKDPLSVLQQDGLPINRKELGEKLLLAELEREMMDPRDLKLKEYEAKLQEVETEKQKAAREAEEHQMNQKRELKRQEISQMFVKAMESSPLSKDPETAALAMRDMAMMLRAAKERGIEVSPEDLAQHAESRYNKGMYALAQRLEGEDLIGFLGEEVVKKIRKADLARLKANNQQTQTHKNDSWEVDSGKKAAAPSRLSPIDARQRAREALFGK